jgi:phosphatidylglycerophosphate synthase
MGAIHERSDDETEPEPSVAGRWKERLDDPLNRFYRYPLARLLVRVLVKTPVTPNQVTFVQPFLAAAAGYLITFPDHAHLVAGALLFELRAVLDCADGTLARAKQQTSAAGHAIDAVADWLATVLLYAGIFWHFHLHPPPAGAWSHYLPVGAVLFLAVTQGALRSVAADHYKVKYTSIFEHGRDGNVEALCRKVDALGPDASVFARVDVFIARAEHLAFERERFAGARAGAPPTQAEARLACIRARERSPLARLIAGLWSISNGDAFLSMVTLSLLANRLWEGQLFFALAGPPWILLVVALNAQFARARGLSQATARGRASSP